MILVDTGYFLALVQPRDELHQRAVSWVNSISEPLLVSEYIVWETVNSLSSPADRPKAHLLISHLRTSTAYELVPASDSLLKAGLKLHVDRPDKAWSLTDCISFTIMENRGLHRALAHDHHFEQAGFEALLRRDPA